MKNFNSTTMMLTRIRLTCLLVLAGLSAFAQTTVTYTQQQANYYTTFTAGTAGNFNQGSFQLGMYANAGGTKQVASFRKFRTDGSGSSTGDRSMKVGDQFVVTLSATRAYGRIGFSLLASPSATTAWTDRENNYAMSMNLDGNSGAWGNWYAKYNGGGTSAGSANVAGQQTTYKNFTFTLTLTAPDRMNATWTDGTTTSNLYDIQLNTSNPITDYCVFLEDDWDGGANRNIYWGLGAVGTQHTLTNTGNCTIGQSNSSFTTSGVIFNGLDANSASTNSLNNNLVKSGTGTLTLSGANTYVGTTTVNGGSLLLGASGVIPDASNVTLNGGTLSSGSGAGFTEVMGTLNLSANSTLALGTGAHTITFANSSAVSWTANTILTVTGWTGTNNGNSSGTAGKLFVGNGFGGLTGIQLSRIRFNISGTLYGAMQLSTGEVVPTGGTVLYYGGANGTWTGSLWSVNEGGPYTTAWTSGCHAVMNLTSGANTLTGATTNIAAITVNAAVTYAIGGTWSMGPAGAAVAPIYVDNGVTFSMLGQGISVTAGNGIIKNGSGILQGANGNNYLGGFTINNGMFAIGGINSMGNGGTLNINGGTLAGTANRDLTGKFSSITIGGDFTLGSSTSPASGTATLTFTNNTALGSSVTRTITLGGTGLITWNGIISGTSSNLTIGATAAGSMSLGGVNTFGGNFTVNAASSTITLAAANSYGGGTVVNAGTLKLTISSAIPSGSALSFANTSGAILDLTTTALTHTVASLSGGGSTGGNISFGAPATGEVLTINQSGNTTYSGLISGNGSITKTGAGILTFGHTANTYTGSTTISAGELRLNPSTTTATFASPVILSGGKLSTTSITAATTFTSSSTLKLNASSSIDLGSNAHSLKFAASNGVAWTGATTLTINGWTGTGGATGTAGKIFFGSAVGTLTGTQLGQITFTGYTGTPILLSTGELVPPVPSVTYTWTGGAGDFLWTSPANWSPGTSTAGVGPTATDNVVIPVATNMLNLNVAKTAANFTLSGTGSFQVGASGSLTVTGTLTNSSSATPTFNCGSTFTVSSAGQTIPAWNYGNLVLSGTTATLASSGTIGICGSYTPSATTTVTGSTVDFNGSTAQSILTNAAVFNNLTISNTASTVTSGVNVTVNGTGTINSSATFIQSAGTFAANAVATTVNGTLRVTSTGAATGSAANLIFSSTGTYDHNRDGGAIPSASWNATSNCNITGINATLCTNTAQTFGNFLWNCPSSSTTFNFGAALMTNVVGLCEIRNTNGATGTLGFDATRTWTGNLSITGGRIALTRTGSATSSSLTVNNFTLDNTSDANARFTLGGNASNVASTLTVNGTFTITLGQNAAVSPIIVYGGLAGTENVNVVGNFSQTGAFTGSIGGSSSRNFNFTGAGTRTISWASSTLWGSVAVNVNSPAIIDIANYVLNNTGTFTLNSGAGIITANVNGLTTSGATGSIQSSGSRTYTSGANYTYNGTASQATGNGLNQNTPTNVNIDNTAGVTLSGATTISGVLTLTNGKLDIGANDLTLSSVGLGSVTGASSSKYIITSGAGQLLRAISTGGYPLTYTYPVGDASNYTPAAFNFTSGGTARNIGVRVVNTVHPSNTPSTDYANRYWAVSNSNAAGTFAYTPTFTIVDPGDIGAGSYANMKINRWNGTSWTQYDTSPNTTFSTPDFTLTSTLIQFTIVNGGTNEFAIRLNNPAINYTWNGGTSSSWTTTTNWTPNGTPGVNDNITIPDVASYTNELIVSGSKTVTDFTVSANGKYTLGAASSLNVAGNYTYSSSTAPTFDCTSTLSLSSASSQTVPAHNYGHLNLSGGDRVLASSGTIGICGNYTPSSGVTTITGSTVDFNGTSAQTIITNAASFNNLTISNTSSTVTASVNVTINGTATINSSATYVQSANTLTIAAATTTNVNGTLRNSGGTITNSGTLNFNASSIYDHARDGGAVPTATWNATSNCNITGINATLCTNTAQTFGNFLWNCPSSSTSFNFGAALMTNVVGLCEIRNTNGATGTLGFDATRTWTGNLSITGGRIALTRTGSATSSSLTVNNFTLDNTSDANARFTIGGSGSNVSAVLTTNGNFTMVMGQNAAATPVIVYGGILGTENIIVKGNFSHSGSGTGTISRSGTGGTSETFTFTPTGAQTFTSANASLFGLCDVVLNGTGSLAFDATSIIANTTGATPTVGRFTLASGATIITANTGGLSLTGSTGSIQSGGTRTYNAAANYTYNGSSAQITGLGLVQANNLTINNAAGVTLSAGTTITNNVNLSNGVLTLNTADLIINNAATITGTFGPTAMIATTGSASRSSGRVMRMFPSGTSSGSFTFPLGDITGTAEYSPITISLSYTGATLPPYVAYKVKDAQNPSDPSITNYISRYWEVTSNLYSATGISFTTTSTYVTADIVGTETLIEPNRLSQSGVDIGTWYEDATGSAGSNTLNGATLTSANDFNDDDLTGRLTVPIYFRSNVATGNFESPGSWLVSTDPAFLAPVGTTTTASPTYSNCDGIEIMSGHNITIAAAAGIDQATVNSGGTLTIGAGATLVVYNGTGTDLQVNGSLVNQSSIAVTLAGTLVIGSTGLYNHNINSGTIPSATWTAGSNCLISGMTTTAPSGLGQAFSDFTFNSTLSASNSLSSALTNVGRDLTINGTGGFTLGLTSTTALALTVGRDLNVTSGFLTLVTGANTNTVSLTVSGDLKISGNGGFSIAGGSSSGAGSTTLTVNGLVNNTSSSGTSFVMSGASKIVTATIANGYSQSSGTASMSQGSGATTLTIATGGFTLSGTGSFNMNNGGTGGATMNITSGDFTQSAGNFNLCASSTGPAYINQNNAANGMVLSGGTMNVLLGNSVTYANRPIITLAGSFSQSGSHAFDWGGGSVSNTASPYPAELRVAKDFSRAGTSTINCSSGSVTNKGLILFNGTQNISSLSTGTFNKTETQISGTSTLNNDFTMTSGANTVFTINSGGRLNTNNYVVSAPGGTPTFTLSSGGTISLTAASGTSNSTGNIQINAPTYNAGGNYLFEGSTSGMVTGPYLPASVTGNITINNSNGVTLSNNLTIGAASVLTLTSGVFDLGTSNLILTSGATISNYAISRYIKTSSTGTIRQTLATNTPVLFPVGNSGYNPITLSQSGASDNYTLRMIDGAISGLSPNDVTKTINRNWSFTRTSSSIVSITASSISYNVGEENNATNFNAGTQPYYGLYNGALWVQATATQGAQTFTSANAVSSSTSTSFNVAMGKDDAFINPSTTYTWVGNGAAGDWTDPNNWNPSTSLAGPLPGDNIIINAPGTASNNLNLNISKTVTDVTFNGTGVMALGASGSLTINGTVTYGGSFSATLNCSSTINYANTTALTIPPFNYGNLVNANASVRTWAASATTGICGTLTAGIGSTFTAGAGSTVDYNGTGAQTVVNLNYNNLTISQNRGGATVTLASGTIDVAGTFNPSLSNNSISYSGNTINFSGSAGQGIPAFTYNNITSSNLARTWANSGVIDVNGTFAIPSSGVQTVTGSTVRYSSTAAGTITLTSFSSSATPRHYNNLEIVGGASSIWNLASGFNLGCAGNFDLTGAGTFTVAVNATANSMTVDGNLTVSGSGNLIIANTATATLVNNLTVTGNTTISNGLLTCIGASSSTTVQGNLSTTDLTISGSGAVNLDAASNTASAAITVNGNMSVTSTSASAVNFGSGTNNANNVFNLKGNLSKSGTGSFNCTGTFNSTTGFFFNNGSGTQQFSYAGTAMTAANINVSAASTLQLMSSFNLGSAGASSLNVVGTGVLIMGTNVVTAGNSANLFSLSSTGTLKTANTSGVIGSIAGFTFANCTFASGAIFEFNGAAAQNTGVSTFTGITTASFYTITWTGTTSLTLDKSWSLNTLNFTNSGLIYLGTNNLTITSAGSITGGSFSASKMIVTDNTGTLVRSVTSVGVGLPFTWPIGENTGTTEYSPVTIASLASGGIAGSIGFRVVDGIQPNMSPATIYASRYWPCTVSGYNATYTLGSSTFTYVPGDIVVGPESSFKGDVYNSTTSLWTELASSSAVSSVLTIASGLNGTVMPTGGSSATYDIAPRVDVPTYYQTVASGNWTTLGTWEISTDPAFVSPAGSPAVSVPTNLNSAGIFIRNGHTVTVNTSLSGDDVTIYSGGTLQLTGNTFTLANGSAATDLTVNSGGTLLCASATNNSLVVASGASMQVNGLFMQAGSASPDLTNSGTITIGATGTYEHARNAGIIPTCTWTAGSLCLLSAVTNNVPSGLAQSFHHFTVNTTLTASVSTSGNLQTILGDFNLTTNHASFAFSLSAGTSYSLNVSGDMTINNGILDCANSGAGPNSVTVTGTTTMTGANSQITKKGPAAMTWNFNGNYTQNSGTLEFNAGGSSNTTVNFRGDVVMNGPVQRTNGGTHLMNFLKASGVQTLSQGTPITTAQAIVWAVGNGTTTNTVQMLTDVNVGTSGSTTFTVNNAATLDFQDKTLYGTNAPFSMGATATLKMGSQYGITTAAVGATSGNLQTQVAGRVVQATGTFIYSGTVNQVTGNLLPSTLTGTGKLTISNTGTIGNNTVTLTTTPTTTPTFNLVSGLFAAGVGQTLNITSGGTVNATGGDFVTGSTAGFINFPGTGTWTGSCNPYNVNISGGVNFGAGTVTIQNSGTLKINAGGFVSTNAPFYNANSNLQYNVTSGTTYGRGLEWYQSAGRGYPGNVRISNNNTLDPANGGGNINGSAAVNTVLNCAGSLTIDAGSSMYMDFGGNNMQVNLNILGSLNISGNLSSSGTAGKDIYVGRDWNYNTGASYNANTRAVFLNGSVNQNVGGTASTTFPYLVLNNSAGATLTISQTVSNTLTLTNGKLTLGNFDLNSNGTISGASTSNYVVTNGTGRLKQTVAASNVAFPVGNSTYNPITLNNTGTSDVYGVIAKDGAAGSESDNTKIVLRNWDINEASAGGSNLAITTQWNAPVAQTGQEASNFVRADASRWIGNYTGGVWTQNASSLAGSDPYTYTASGFTSLGIFEPGIQNAFLPIPIITGYSPTSAYTGEVITITGSNLNTLTSVTIGGTTAVLTTPAPTSSTAYYIVGSGTSGNVVATNAFGSFTASTPFTYLGYITNNPSDWNTGSTWLGGNVPIANATTTVNHAITINAAVVNSPNSITINSTKSITFGASGGVTVNNTLTNGGTIDMTSGGVLTMASGSTFANGSSTFTGGTGTVVFAGTGTVTSASGVPFNNVTLNGSVNPSAGSSIAGTLRVNQSGSINTNALSYGAASTLLYNGTSAQTPNALEFPSSSGPVNFTANNPSNVYLPFSRTISGDFRILTGTVSNLSGSAVTLTMSGSNATLEVTGTLQGTDVGAGNDINLIVSGALTSITGSNVTTLKVLNATVNSGSTLALARSNVEVRYGAFNINGTGTLRIDANGNVAAFDANSRVPIYASTANLVYNSGGSYGRYVEWSTLSGPAGYPGNVIIQNGTTLNIGTPSTDLGIYSNLSLGQTGSAGSLNMQSTPQGITVGGDVTIGSNTGTSTLTLSTNASSPALRLSGNWNRTSNGAFVGTGSNGRGVFFEGGNAQTITAPSTETFEYLLINKTSGTNVTLNSPVVVNATLTFTSGTVTLGSNDLTAATQTGGNVTSYAITNGAGKLKLNVNNTNIFFPIGPNSTTYAPATLNQASTAEVIGVSVANAPSYTPAVNDNTQMVTLEWKMNESVAGSNSLMTQFQWASSSEAGSFIRANGVFHGTWNGTTYTVRPASATTGSNPYISTSTVNYTSTLSNQNFVVGNISGIIGCFSTVANGIWNDANTWSSGVIPPGGSSVCINNTITVGPSDPDVTALGVTINASGSINLDVARTLTILTTGALVNNSGSNQNFGLGSVYANGVLSIAGANVFLLPNLTLNGNTTVTTSPTILSNLTLNSGAFLTASPTYGSNATLIYNTGGSYTVSNEWTGNSATPGLGIPKNVTLTGTTLNMPTSDRGIGGNLSISSGTVNMNGTSGDLYVGGNWTRASFATFNPNGRAVFFNGSTNQTISVTSSGTETFSYLLVAKSGGNLILDNTNPTNVTVSASSGNVLQLNSGTTIDLNGNTMSLTGTSGNVSLLGGANSVIGSANSVFAISGGLKTIVPSGGATLSFGSNVKVALSNGINFGSSTSTINGTLQIALGGYVSGNAPTYASGSTLRYFSGSTYGRGLEWSTNSGPGYPYHVTVDQNGTVTTADLSTGSATCQLAGDLTLNNGGNMTMGAMTSPLIILGNAVIGGASSGTLTLSSAAGGDVRIAGDLTRNAGGTLTQNGREVEMNGTTVQNINGVTSFAYLAINNSGASVKLNANSTISNRLRLTNGSFDLNGQTCTMANGSKILRINGTMTASPSVAPGDLYDLEYQASVASSFEFISANDAVRDLIITTGNTLTLGASRTFNRDLTLSGGDLNLATYTLTARGNAVAPSFSGSITVSGGGTRTITGAAGSGFDFTGFGANNPTKYTKTVSTFGGTLLNFDSNVLVRIGDGSVDFGSGSPTTINGVLQVLLGGSVGQILNPCYYGSNSILRFANTVDYQVGVNDKTWASGSISSGNPGIPYNVEVNDNGTDLQLQDTRALRNNLAITDGTFTLTPAYTSTFNIGGNWTRSGATSAFNHNSKKVVFDKQAAGNQTITVSSGVTAETFYDLEVSPVTGNLQAGSSSALNVLNTLNFVSGKLDIGANRLTIGTASANGSITNASSSMYVISNATAGGGNIRRYTNTNATFDFPVGDAGGYNPVSLTLSNGGQAGAYITTTVVSGMHPNMTAPAPTIYIARYWSVEPTGLATSPVYDINYTYITGDEVGVGTMYPVKYSTATATPGWQSCPGSLAAAVTGTAGGNNVPTKTFSWTGLTTFSDFSGAGDGSPLPIELLNFTATPKGEVVVLDWSTASEINNDYFTLERSDDLVKIESVGKVAGAGNSTNILNYTYSDKMPLSGVSYYRLRQTDFNGSTEVSDWVPVTFNKGNTALDFGFFLTNRGENFLQFGIANTAPITSLEVIDATGRVIVNEVFETRNSNTSKTLYMPEIAPGVYFLRVQSGGQQLIRKFGW